MATSSVVRHLKDSAMDAFSLIRDIKGEALG
jgi:hypothetical protein